MGAPLLASIYSGGCAHYNAFSNYQSIALAISLTFLASLA